MVLLADADPELYAQLSKAVVDVVKAHGYHRAEQVLKDNGMTSAKQATQADFQPLMDAFKKALKSKA